MPFASNPSAVLNAEAPLPFDTHTAKVWADRRRADGTRSVWAVESRGAGAQRTYTLTRWDAIHGQWSPVMTVERHDMGDALTAGGELLMLRPDELTDYGSRRPHVERLLALLEPAGDGEPWDYEVDWDRELPDEGFHLSNRRYAFVNQHPVWFVPHGQALWAFLSDHGDTVEGEPVAEFRFGSESGAGASELVRVGEDRGVEIPSGDLIDGVYLPTAFDLPSEPGGLAYAVADWLDHVAYRVTGVPGAAAVALEPLDPDSLLTPERRAEWKDAIRSLVYEYGESLEAKFHIAETTRTPLRAAMKQRSDTYRRVAQALADPLSGEWLLPVLFECRQGELS